MKTKEEFAFSEIRYERFKLRNTYILLEYLLINYRDYYVNDFVYKSYFIFSIYKFIERELRLYDGTTLDNISVISRVKESLQEHLFEFIDFHEDRKLFECDQ